MAAAPVNETAQALTEQEFPMQAPTALAFGLASPENKTAMAAKKSATWEDQMKEMSEMNNFATEEDKAITAQLDGEAVVTEIKKDFTNDFGKDAATKMKPKWNQKKPTSLAQASWYVNRRAGQ